MLETYFICTQYRDTRKKGRALAQAQVTIPIEIARDFIQRYGTEIQFFVRKDGLLIKPKNSQEKPPI